MCTIKSYEHKDEWDNLSSHNHTGLDKKNTERKIVNIFLPISFNICFGCSKEPSR